MTDRDESLPANVQRSLDELPREVPPDVALEDRVVRALVASGAIGQRRRYWPWIVATAAALVLAVGLQWFRTPRPAPGVSYMLLLYDNDSTLRRPESAEGARRFAEYAQWADSLQRVGELERTAALAGPGEISGFFIVRAPTDAAAARIAAACPHLRYGGRVVVRRLIE
jgi:hypothetical protein